MASGPPSCITSALLDSRFEVRLPSDKRLVELQPAMNISPPVEVQPKPDNNIHNVEPQKGEDRSQKQTRDDIWASKEEATKAEENNRKNHYSDKRHNSEGPENSMNSLLFLLFCTRTRCFPR